MKTISKKLFVIILFVLASVFAFTFIGCTGAKDGADFAAPDLAAPDGVDGDIAEDGGNENGTQTPIVKQLTAAEWRDALNYDFWLNLFEKDIPVDGQESEEQLTRNGIFHPYSTATRGLDTFNMHEVSVTSDGNPIIGAEVKLFSDSEVVYSAMTDSSGTAYVFGEGTRIEAKSGDQTASADLADGVTNISITNSFVCEDELEIMLVVDTTGSMGDELSFLCNELAGVVTRVSSALNCKIRLGLLFYRDKGDEYVTRKFDFVDVTSSNGLNTVVKNIKKQKSSGGGDYPEAVDTALSEAVAADWHTYSRTRLLFQVLDAPYHDEQENQGRFADAVKSAAQKGIRIIPVAASGLDTLGQYIMRSSALLTGGTYAFLTDDSGIGNSHELPATGEYTVEYLSDLMVRLIKGYYTGTFDEPVSWTKSDSVA